MARRLNIIISIIRGIRASAHNRHTIIARLVDRIDVEEGNKITIKYKVSFEQFMSADQASA